MTELSSAYLLGLVRELCKLPTETEWIEFKHNKAVPDDIGEYISALANSAAILGKPQGYLVWGIDDTTHEILGTTFDPSTSPVGNEELESWLLQRLSPKLKPLVSVQRFLDTPPKSRNEALASLMRRFRICEERGSGIDKVVFQTELYQLPAPLFETGPGFTRTVLFAHQDMDAMSKEDRVRACYLHACLQYVQRQSMTNKSLRERFGLDESKGAQITRILNATQSAGLILKVSSSESRRDSSYIPFWSTSQGLKS